MKIAATLLGLLGALGLGSCDKEDIHRAEEKIERGVDKAGEKLEKARDRVDDKTDYHE